MPFLEVKIKFTTDGAENPREAERNDKLRWEYRVDLEEAALNAPAASWNIITITFGPIDQTGQSKKKKKKKKTIMIFVLKKARPPPWANEPSPPLVHEKGQKEQSTDQRSRPGKHVNVHAASTWLPISFGDLMFFVVYAQFSWKFSLVSWDHHSHSKIGRTH